MEKIRGLEIYPEKIRGLKILGLFEENTPGGYSQSKMSAPLHQILIQNVGARQYLSHFGEFHLHISRNVLYHFSNKESHFRPRSEERGKNIKFHQFLEVFSSVFVDRSDCYVV